jgi:hypothetical protein
MATPLKHILKDFLQKKKNELESLGKITEAINRMLSREAKNHVYPKGIHNNKITFYSDSSSATYDFNLHKEELLREIQKEFPTIASLHIKTGQK